MEGIKAPWKDTQGGCALYKKGWRYVYLLLQIFQTLLMLWGAPSLSTPEIFFYSSPDTLHCYQDGPVW